MAKNQKETHEYVYVGPEQTAMEAAEHSPAPPSNELAKTVALSILGGHVGSYRRSEHFRQQMADRNFDVFDIEYAIRNGRCIGVGIYSVDNKNHKYLFRCDIDGVEFDAVFALSAEHDLIKSPLMILVTGCWKTKTGKRRNRY